MSLNNNGRGVSLVIVDEGGKVGGSSRLVKRGDLGVRRRG